MTIVPLCFCKVALCFFFWGELVFNLALLRFSHTDTVLHNGVFELNELF